MTLVISLNRVIKILSIIIICLTITSLAGQITQYVFEIPRPLARIFHQKSRKRPQVVA